MKKARNGFIKNLRYMCLIGVIALGLMTIVGSNGGDGGGDGGGGGGDNETTADIVGVWIIDDLDDDDEYAFIEFGSEGIITRFQGIGFDQNPGTYSYNSDGTYSGTLEVPGGDTYQLEGNIASESSGEITLTHDLDPNITYSGTMEKVTDISKCEGTWEGNYTETGIFGENSYSLSFDIGSTGSINAFAGFGSSVAYGKFYSSPSGSTVGYIELTNFDESRYEMVLFSGNYEDVGGGVITISGSAELDTNETDYDNNFVIEKVSE
jgi:hypothetical protein